MSNKTSDKNVSNVEVIKDFILELKEFELNKDTLEIANALEDLLSEREQDKKYIKNLEIALKIINKVTDIDETKEENVVLLKEVLRKLEDISYGRG